MPEIRNKNPGVGKGTPPKKDEDQMFGRIADAINNVAHALAHHSHCATRQDLVNSELRIIAAIGGGDLSPEDSLALDRLAQESGVLTTRIESLSGALAALDNATQ